MCLHAPVSKRILVSLYERRASRAAPPAVFLVDFADTHRSLGAGHDGR